MIELSEDLKFPDFWQTQVVNALQKGLDVLLYAPTGAGKTYAFEIFFTRHFKGSAVYTVPTRALANDKFREWRRAGWNVGIATGDYSFNTSAPLVVATLETQKMRILKGECADLLVIDEYQLIADSQRGANYETAIAMCPKDTQLMLLSGSVKNRGEVLEWLKRLGRDAVLIEHDSRPVALEEIYAEALCSQTSAFFKNSWGTLAKKIIEADMAPLLIFAPKRLDAEIIAKKIAEEFAPKIEIPRELMSRAGRKLAYFLRRGVAFHHSGLSAFQRSQIVEDLAKSGKLSVVVATTGLGAGINFSMRSVIVADREYESMGLSHTLRPDELLQMYGRAGRRGLDSVGYAITLSGDKPSLSQAHPIRLSRSKNLDWTAILWLMSQAVRQGRKHVEAAKDYCARLFNVAGGEKIDLGFSEAAKLSQEAGAEKSKALLTEILNSKNLWQRRGPACEAKIADTLFFEGGEFKKFEESKEAVKSLKRGGLCEFKPLKLWGISLRIATIAENSKVFYRLNKAIASKLRPMLEPCDSALLAKGGASLKTLRRRFAKYCPRLFWNCELVEFADKGGALFANLKISNAKLSAIKDSYGAFVFNPPTRVREIENGNSFEIIGGFKKSQSASKSVAQTWLDLGLVDGDFKPTLRGEIFSRFNGGEGLAIAAALEDESYSIEEIFCDLANLRAGVRFEKSSKVRSASSRLADICRLKYAMLDVPGYLSKGVPLGYGEGASELVRKIAEGKTYAELEDEILRRGDIERAYVEWRSVIRHIALSEDLDCERFLDLKSLCARFAD